MERRRKAAARKTASRIDLPKTANHEAIFSSLPHIEDFINYGQNHYRKMEPAGCVAVAGEGRQSVAMLRRRKNETLKQLLVRLDHAVAKAINEDIYTDEINATIK
jgi:hypothetical protein